MNLLSPTKSRLQPLIFLQNGYYRTICSGHRACLSVVEISSGIFLLFSIYKYYLICIHNCIYIFIYLFSYIHIIIEGSLEVKLPTIWTDEKQRWSRRIEKRRAEERRSEKRKSQKKEDADARKGGKAAKQCVFPMICGSGRSKSRLAKAAGAKPSGQMRDEKVHAIVARSTFRIKMCKTHQCRTTFGS